MKAKLFAIVVSSSILSNVSLAANNSDNLSNQVEQKVIAKKINLNSASANELTNSFKGIGAKRATNIVNYRDKHGKFKEISELALVNGLGKAFVDKYLSQLQAIFTIG